MATQFATVAVLQSVTLDCEPGWTYSDLTGSKSFACNAVDTWNPSLEPCEGKIQTRLYSDLIPDNTNSLQ